MKKKMIVLLGVFTLIVGSLAGCGRKTEQADASGTNEPVQEEPAIEFADEEENTVGMGNPWVEITEEEAKGLCFRLFKAPEGADQRDVRVNTGHSDGNKKGPLSIDKCPFGCLPFLNNIIRSYMA